MRNVELKINYQEYNQIDELRPEDRDLLEKATNAIKNAYAPYSLYKVGTAILLEDGNIITGNNQENAAYPSGLCAERVTLFYTSAQFPNLKVKTIAIAAKTKDFEIKEPITPCGACRQVMSEYESKQNAPIRVILKAEKSNILVFEKVFDLLPLMFQAEELKK